MWGGGGQMIYNGTLRPFINKHKHSTKYSQPNSTKLSQILILIVTLPTI